MLAVIVQPIAQIQMILSITTQKSVTEADMRKLHADTAFGNTVLSDYYGDEIRTTTATWRYQGCAHGVFFYTKYF
jgi:hypothetical protein